MAHKWDSEAQRYATIACPVKKIGTIGICESANRVYGFCELDRAHPAGLAARGNGATEESGLYCWEYVSRLKAVKLPNGHEKILTRKLPGRDGNPVGYGVNRVGNNFTHQVAGGGAPSGDQKKPRTAEEDAAKLSQILARQQKKKDQAKSRDAGKKKAGSERNNARSGKGGGF